MPGSFFIVSACASRSRIVPSTISCITLPVFFRRKRTVSPCFTASSAGAKRIASLMSRSIVRDTFFGSPARPTAAPAVAWPAWPCAAASWAKRPSMTPIKSDRLAHEHIRVLRSLVEHRAGKRAQRHHEQLLLARPVNRRGDELPSGPGAAQRVVDVGVVDDHLRAGHGVTELGEALALLLDEERALMALLFVLDQLHWSPYLAR